MSKHTPGPWEALSATADGFVVRTTIESSTPVRVRVIAEYWPCVIVDEEHRTQLLANAALIAAAPELAECLRELLWDQVGPLTQAQERAAALLERLGS